MKCEDIKRLQTYFDEYNNEGFTDVPSYMLPIYQSDIWNLFKYIKTLLRIERCEATKMYMIFCGKLMLRLSYLRAQGYKENDTETGSYFKDFFNKYNL